MPYGVCYERATGRILGVYEGEETMLHAQAFPDPAVEMVVLPERPDPVTHFAIRDQALCRKIAVSLTLHGTPTVGETVAVKAVPAAEGPPLRSQSFHVTGVVTLPEPCGGPIWRMVVLRSGLLRCWVDDAQYYSDPLVVMVR